MKQTDYSARATGFDIYIPTKSIGVEVGVNAGSHAEAILTYCDIEKITLIDTWEDDYIRGYCEGRLKNWRTRVGMVKGCSHEVSHNYHDEIFDWIYIDITHDYATVKESLQDWWPKLKARGMLGYRNYSSCKKAIDEFVITGIKSEVDSYYNEIVLFKP